MLPWHYTYMFCVLFYFFSLRFDVVGCSHMQTSHNSLTHKESESKWQTEIGRENQIIFCSNKKQAASKQKSLRPYLRASKVISRIVFVLVCDGVFSVNISNRWDSVFLLLLLLLPVIYSWVSMLFFFCVCYVHCLRFMHWIRCKIKKKFKIPCSKCEENLQKLSLNSSKNPNLNWLF